MSDNTDTGNTTVFGTIKNNARIRLAVDTDVKTPAITKRDKSGGLILDSIRSKMVADPRPQERSKDNEAILEPDQGYIDAVANDSMLTASQARGLLDALPDLELSKQIIVSSILSPNDMVSTDIIYGCASSIFGDATQSLVAVVQDYFDEVYKIKKQLPDIIGKAIFTDGSYALAIFPETSIDAAINSNLTISRESITMLDQEVNNPLWILGNPIVKDKPNIKKEKSLMASFESAYNPHTVTEEFKRTVSHEALHLTVTDNPAVVRVPKMLKRIKRRSVISKYSKTVYSPEYYENKYSKEPLNKTTKTIDHIYPDRMSKSVKILDMSNKQGDERNVGHPVVFTPQAVIPVFEPGAPSEHVGYFIPLDDTGNPLSTVGYEDQFKELQSMAKGAYQLDTGVGGGYGNYDSVTSVLNPDKDKSPVNAEESARLYGSIIEKELTERLKNGDYNENHSIAKATSIYRMMFTRACMAMNTQLLYVPAEFMTYFAYDYHENGTGKSLLEKTKSISSMRMINIMANTMASIKGAINNRVVEIILDPEDPDPMKSIEQHMHEFTRATQSEFPIGKLSYADITDSIQKAGVSVNVTGHPSVPETRMNVSNTQNSYAQTDTELDDRLTRQNIMGLGIPPDSVNSATEMEFDKNVVTYNNLSNKINMVRQDITCIHLTDFIQKYTRNSSPLVEKLTEIVKKNRGRIDGGADVSKLTDETLANIFINYIEVTLPEANTVKISNEMDAFNTYEQALDVFLNAFISDEMMSAELMGEEVSNSMRSMRPVIKAHFLRRYLSEKNIAPELFTLVATGDMENEYFDILDQHEEYISSIMPAFKKFIIRTMQMGNQGDGVILAARSILEQIKQKREEAMNKEAGGMVETPTNNASTDDTDNNDDTEEGGDDDDMFGDGFDDEGGEDDLGDEPGEDNKDSEGEQEEGDELDL